MKFHCTQATMPIRSLLVLALSVSLSQCSPNLETSGVPTFFDPKYHDDGRDSEPVVVAEYTPLESIQSPFYSTYTQLVGQIRSYPAQEVTPAVSEPATFTKAESDLYFSDSYFPSQNNAGQIREVSASVSNSIPPVEVQQPQGSSQGRIVKSSSVAESHSPSKDEYKSIPILEAGDVVPSTPATLRLNIYEAPASDQHYEAHNNVPQQYVPGSGWQAASPQPSPTPAQVQGYFHTPAQSYSYSSGLISHGTPGQTQNNGDSWSWGPSVSTPTAYQAEFAPLEPPKSTPSAYQAGFAPLEPPKSTPSAYQAGFAHIPPSTEASPPPPSRRPQAIFDSNEYLKEYPLEEVYNTYNPESSPPPPSVQHKPLSSYYAEDDSPPQHPEVVEHRPASQEYGHPVKTFSVSEEEYKAYLTSEQPMSGGFKSNPSFSSPHYSPSYAYGPVDEAKYYAPPPQYQKPKDTLYNAYQYFAKNHPYASGYGFGSLKANTKGDWNWKAQSYGIPYDLVSKGPYKASKTKPYRTRGNGWSQGTPALAPMKGYRYKYNTMYHPGTVKDNVPVSTLDELENGPEEFEEEDNLDIYDCENRHRCKSNDADISESVELTRKKPKENKFLRNDLFKRLIKNIANKRWRRPRRPPPPPPRRPRKCKGPRCRNKPPPKGNKSEKSKIINIVIKN